ncbi:hypothetical protein CDEST_11555 [Colletotrichum destructivum]|uniref:Uncharacterized protein n=1 Tax=Colletotrichum destructivum TaxID=34406 RepID=A0AAX4ITI0_9PEZI|nr:hypothetical protein CDEST_11555 [Colletotrichum destructivum]
MTSQRQSWRPLRRGIRYMAGQYRQQHPGRSRDLDDSPSKIAQVRAAQWHGKALARLWKGRRSRSNRSELCVPPHRWWNTAASTCGGWPSSPECDDTPDDLGEWGGVEGRRFTVHGSNQRLIHPATICDPGDSTLTK